MSAPRFACAALLLVAGAIAPSLASAAAPVSGEICEGRSGAELIRCIEAAARTAPAQGAPAPSRPEPPAPPGDRASAASRSSTTAPPQGVPEDCTGRTGSALRSCLAAGGRLRPEAAQPGPAGTSAPQGDTASVNADCDALTGEALRACVAGTAAASAGRGDLATRAIDCTALLVADQALCVHRNQSLNACRDRKRYPDEALCLRSFMASAPTPAAADCRALPAAQRPACEARNRASAACAGEGQGYFACLDRRLGADRYVRWR